VAKCVAKKVDCQVVSFECKIARWRACRKHVWLCVSRALARKIESRLAARFAAIASSCTRRDRRASVRALSVCVRAYVRACVTCGEICANMSIPEWVRVRCSRATYAASVCSAMHAQTVIAIETHAC
jgi:hypothetical protein